MSMWYRWFCRITLLSLLVGLLPVASPVQASVAIPFPPKIALKTSTPSPMAGSQSAVPANTDIDVGSPSLPLEEWEYDHEPIIDIKNPLIFSANKVGSGAYNLNPHVVMDTNGQLHGVSLNSNTGSESQAGVYYHTPAHIQDATGQATLVAPLPFVENSLGYYSRIAVDPSGGVHLVWVDGKLRQPGSSNTIWYASCSANCTQTASWTITDLAFEFEKKYGTDCPLYKYPDIVATETHVAIAVQSETIRTAVLDLNTGLWSINKVYGPELYGHSITPNLATGPDNTIHLVWNQHQASYLGRLIYAQYTAGAWSTPIRISLPHPQAEYVGVRNLAGDYADKNPYSVNAFTGQFGLTVDAENTVHVAWPQWADPSGSSSLASIKQDLMYRSCSGSCTDINAWDAQPIRLYDEIEGADDLPGTMDRDVVLAHIQGIWF